MNKLLLVLGYFMCFNPASSLAQAVTYNIKHFSDVKKGRPILQGAVKHTKITIDENAKKITVYDVGTPKGLVFTIVSSKWLEVDSRLKEHITTLPTAKGGVRYIVFLCHSVKKQIRVFSAQNLVAGKGEYVEYSY